MFNKFILSENASAPELNISNISANCFPLRPIEIAPYGTTLIPDFLAAFIQNKISVLWSL